MDVLLTKVTGHAMNYAIRSGIAITTSYAINQCGRLLKQTPGGKEREELMLLQLRLESKIRIISPAIDMIELISARGNSSLESAVSLTKEIRYDIQKLGARLSTAANEEELLYRKSSRAKSREENVRALQSIIKSIHALLMRIEDAVPLLSLAITTSGVNLSTKLSGTISPSRLLQASTFLTAADSQYTVDPGSRQQVGPTYTLSVYMLFAGHAWRPVDEAGVREMTWKEVIHRARLKLVRVPLNQLYSLPGESSAATTPPHDSMPANATAAEFAYQLVIIEDLDDDRVHSFEDDDAQPGPFDGVANAGIRDVVPVHEVSKVFYADTGKILNIGGDSDTNTPVLLLKRDVHAEPPRRMLHRSQMSGRGCYDNQATDGAGAPDDQSDVDAQLHRESAPNTPQKGSPTDKASKFTWRLPADLDPEWIALEVFTEDPDSESDPEEPQASSRPSSSREDSPSTMLSGALSRLNMRSSAANSPIGNRQLVPSQPPAGLNLSPNKRGTPPIKTSLSLMEMLLKLTALQQFRQESHLSIEDELLNFFLEDSATAGAGPDKDYRQRLRHDAVRRVGFDPYDESPIKRRTEEYIQHPRGQASPRPEFDPEAFPQQFPYDEEYGYDDSLNRPLDYIPEQQPLLPSSPSPIRPILLQQTPSRNSSPGSTFNSERHHSAIQAKYASSPQSSPPLKTATPPSTAKSRQAVLRSQTEPKPRSPLGKDFINVGSRGSDEKMSMRSNDA